METAVLLVMVVLGSASATPASLEQDESVTSIPNIINDTSFATILIEADKMTETMRGTPEHQITTLKELLEGTKQEIGQKINAFRLEAESSKKETEQKIQNFQLQIDALKQGTQQNPRAIAQKRKIQDQKESEQKDHTEAGPKLIMKQSLKTIETELTMEYNSVLENRILTCPNNFVSINGGCYHFNSEDIKIWNQERVMEQCRTLDSRATLASLESQEEWDNVRNYLTQSKMDNSNWRIGGSDKEEEGRWKWIAGNRLMEFSDWCRGEPNNYNSYQHCMMIAGVSEPFNKERRLCWDDINCNGEPVLKLPMRLICETKRS